MTQQQEANFDETSVIFETIHGSHAYGLNTDESDIDRRGVCIPPRALGLGFVRQFEQQDTWDESCDDRVIFGLRKFFSLAAQSNPNALELLFTEPRFHLRCTQAGEKLLARRQDFLSRQAQQAFCGYALSQLKRIRRHRCWLLDPPAGPPSRTEFGLPERRKLIDASADGAFNAIFADLLHASGQEHAAEDFQKRYMDPESPHFQDWKSLVHSVSAHDPEFFERHAEVLDECMDLSRELITVLSREKAYTSALNEWQQYQAWKRHRNPARAALEACFGYDCKHAMHLVRLMKMGREVLTHGTLQVYRHEDREELLAIRNGQWSYDELLAFAEQEQQALKDLALRSPLPPKPDLEVLNELCVELQMEYYRFPEKHLEIY